MPRRHRSHSIELKRQVVAEYNAGETLLGLSSRHNLCRNLIRIWIAKAKEGEFDDEVAAADLLVRHEARIASLERLFGQQAVELSFVKKGSFCGPSPTNAPTSVIAGPAASPSIGVRTDGCRTVERGGSVCLELCAKVGDA